MKKILLAEDDPAVRTLVSRLLELEGYQVEAFQDGKSALDAVRASAFDLAILDVMMPTVDGLVVLSEIRSNDATSALPVVILTAKADDESTWRGWSGGCDYYLTKPFDPDDLFAAVDRLLGAKA